MRRQEEVVVNGETYTIHEMRVADMMSIMPRMSDEDKVQGATVDLMKLCVYKDGQPMGDAFDEVGISTFMELTEHVMRVNGLSGKG